MAKEVTPMKPSILLLSLAAFALTGWWSEASQAYPAAEPAHAWQAGKPQAQKLARKSSRKKQKSTGRKPKPAPEPVAEPVPEPAAGGGGGTPVGLSGTTRVEFDAQLIKGQTTKAGEVQILERKDTELKSMVRRRTNFRDEIIHTVFPDK
jgi:hypothetical protein